MIETEQLAYTYTRPMNYWDDFAERLGLNLGSSSDEDEVY